VDLTFNNSSSTNSLLVAICKIFKKAIARSVDDSAVDHNFNKILNNGLVKDENDWE